MKILINTVSFDSIGGVSDHFSGLKNKFKETIIFNFIGGRTSSFFFPFLQFFDYLKYIYKILIYKPDLIHLNPSLNKKSILRDSIFLLIARLFKIKVLVFWHGWETDFEKKIEEKYLKLFKYFYNYANAHIVLYSGFKSSLQRWGITSNIFLETTKVDDDLLNDFTVQDKVYKNTILFLSRIVESKGIYVAIDAFRKLKDATLLIAGTGPELDKVKSYIKNNNIKNIIFLGYVRDRDKIDVFKKSDIYIFPTWYKEGMPTSVLEAMSFGLPVITRPVAGLRDFFENEKMGFISDSKDPIIFEKMLNILLQDKQKMRDIGIYNYKYAKENFMASRVSKRLENIYKLIIDGTK